MLREELIARYGPQEESAIRDLSNAITLMVKRMAPGVMDDATQELQLRLLEHKALWPPTFAEFQPYALRSLRNLLIDRARRALAEAARVARVAKGPQSTEPSPFEETVRAEARRAVWEIIACLDAVDQDLAGDVMDDRPEKDVAEKRGMTIRQVRTGKVRIKRQVADILTRRNVDWRDLLQRLRGE